MFTVLSLGWLILSSSSQPPTRPGLVPSRARRGGQGSEKQRSHSPRAGQTCLAPSPHPPRHPTSPMKGELGWGRLEARGWAGQLTDNLGMLSCRGLAWSGDVRSGGRDKWRSVRKRRHGNWVRLLSNWCFSWQNYSWDVFTPLTPVSHNTHD